MSKLRFLAQIALHDPYECADRLEAIFTSRLESRFGKPIRYEPKRAEDALSEMSEALQKQLDWEAVEEIEAEVRERMGTLEQMAPFTTKHHGDFSLARAVDGKYAYPLGPQFLPTTRR